MGKVLQGSGKYYASIQQRQDAQRANSYGQRLIDRANEVSIFDVLEDFFHLSLPRDGASFKSVCPFGFEHEDGGIDRSWRTYPGSNSSMCFALHGFLNPVRLIQLKEGKKAVPAAERILAYYGLLKPRHYKKRYNALLAAREQQSEAPINGQYVVEALHMALRTVPGYESRQFDTDVMLAMDKALEKVNTLVQQRPEEIQKWFSQIKNALLRVVEEGNSNAEGR